MAQEVTRVHPFSRDRRSLAVHSRELSERVRRTVAVRVFCGSALGHKGATQPCDLVKLMSVDSPPTATTLVTADAQSFIIERSHAANALFRSMAEHVT